jgi:hypothetical protein
MTEADWLACSDPQKMLEFLRGRASDRKLRLFACVLARGVWHLLRSERCRKAVLVAEAFADGMASRKMLMAGGNAAQQFAGPYIAYERMEQFAAALATARATAYAQSGSYAAYQAARTGRTAGVSPEGQCAYLRDLFANPFRSIALDPAWPTWHGGSIPQLAQAIYEDRDLPSGHLDHNRLAVLADALEDAGCTDQDILSHCRGPGPHVRGCWVIDLLLGKE